MIITISSQKNETIHALIISNGDMIIIARNSTGKTRRYSTDTRIFAITIMSAESSTLFVPISIRRYGMLYATKENSVNIGMIYFSK